MSDVIATELQIFSLLAFQTAKYVVYMLTCLLVDTVDYCL